MAAPISTPRQRRDLLAARRLDPSPTLLTPSQAAACEELAHVDVEATYSRGHFEGANFEGLHVEGAHDLGLRDGVRYRVAGVLTPRSPPGARRVGYNGPRLHPFEVEAVSDGRPVEHAGLVIRAYRSPGSLRDDGRGAWLEPRQSRLDVLVAHSAEVVYIAVLRVLSRATEAHAVLRPCRDVWRELFPAVDRPSVFHHLECIDPVCPVAVQLPDDAILALFALRERLLAGIQRSPDTCGADALLLAFSPKAVHCLRLGGHRVLRRNDDGLAPVLWEHDIRHDPPGPSGRGFPEHMQRIGLWSLAPGSSPDPIRSFEPAAGERWIGVSGGLFKHLADDAVEAALRRGSADDIAAWLAAEAARAPDEHEHSREWSLLVVDTGVPGPARPREAPAALDVNALLAQLHDLERDRR